MAAYHQAKLVSHAQRVLRLYKKCLRGCNGLRGAWKYNTIYHPEGQDGRYDGFLVLGEKSKDTPNDVDKGL